MDVFPDMRGALFLDFLPLPERITPNGHVSPPTVPGNEKGALSVPLECGSPLPLDVPSADAECYILKKAEEIFRL